MDAERLWFAMVVLAWVVIMTALFHYMMASGVVRDLHWKVENDNRDLRCEIRDLRRDVGAVQREIEFRREQDDRDVDRLLSEIRRSR